MERGPSGIERLLERGRPQFGPGTVPLSTGSVSTSRRLLGVAVDLALALAAGWGIEAAGVHGNAAFATLLVVVTAYVALGSAAGATLGNAAFGIVVRDRTSGGRLPLDRAILRALLVVWLTVSLLGLVADLAYLLGDQRRTALHDLVADATVRRRTATGNLSRGG